MDSEFIKRMRNKQERPMDREIQIDIRGDRLPPIGGTKTEVSENGEMLFSAYCRKCDIEFMSETLPENPGVGERPLGICNKCAQEDPPK